MKKKSILALAAIVIVSTVPVCLAVPADIPLETGISVQATNNTGVSSTVTSEEPPDKEKSYRADR